MQGATGRPAVRKRPPVRTTILVIEDERFVRNVTCELLRHSGYRALPAECATAAQRIFQRHGERIQLLLCDAVLPDGSGELLVQTLRGLSPGLKVILASGYPRSALPPHFDSQPQGEFLAKPYGAASLLAKVQKVLQSGGRCDQVRSAGSSGRPGESFQKPATAAPPAPELPARRNSGAFHRRRKKLRPGQS